MLWKTKSEHNEVTLPDHFLMVLDFLTTSRHLLVRIKKEDKGHIYVKAIIMTIATWKRVGETLPKMIIKRLTHRFCRFTKGHMQKFSETFVAY